MSIKSLNLNYRSLYNPAVPECQGLGGLMFPGCYIGEQYNPAQEYMTPIERTRFAGKPGIGRDMPSFRRV